MSDLIDLLFTCFEPTAHNSDSLSLIQTIGIFSNKVGGDILWQEQLFNQDPTIV